jgi:hypothetical protein
MSFEEWALAACVVFSGLWAGLTAMLTLDMHPMLKAMNGREFALFLRAGATSRSTGSASSRPWRHSGSFSRP